MHGSVKSLDINGYKRHRWRTKKVQRHVTTSIIKRLRRKNVDSPKVPTSTRKMDSW